MPALSAAHKAKISEGLKKYHACAKAAGCCKPKGAVAVRRKFKRLKRAGSKAAPKKTAAKKPTGLIPRSVVLLLGRQIKRHTPYS